MVIGVGNFRVWRCEGLGIGTSFPLCAAAIPQPETALASRFKRIKDLYGTPWKFSVICGNNRILSKLGETQRQPWKFMPACGCLRTSADVYMDIYYMGDPWKLLLQKGAGGNRTGIPVELRHRARTEKNISV